MRKSKAPILFFLLFSLLPLATHAGFAAQPGRKQAEREIRRMIYKMCYAQRTGDITTVKELTARRALEMYRFAFGLLWGMISLSIGPTDETEGEIPRIAEGDDAFSFFFRLATEASIPKMSPEHVEALARAEAKRPIAFINDRKARIYMAEDGTAVFAVFEDGRWKMDDTELIKAELLQLKQSGLLMITPEQEEHIKKFLNQ